MKELHWFPLYVFDWKTDEKVRLMGPIARAYYFDLLCYEWIEGSIPADREAVAALLTMPQDPVENPAQTSLLEGQGPSVDHDAVLDQVLACFVPRPDDGRLINPKLERVRVEQQAKVDETARTASRAGSVRSDAKARAARENGRRGGRPKKGKTETQQETQQNPTEKPWVSADVENKGLKTQQIQIQIQNQNLSQESVGFPIDDLVTKIAAEHPALAHLKGRPLSQVQEFAIAEAIVRDGPDLVLTGTRNLGDAVSQWPSDERRFVPNPVRFYQQSEYLKDPAAWRGRSQKKPAVPGYVPLPADYVPASVKIRRELELRKAALQ